MQMICKFCGEEWTKDSKEASLPWVFRHHILAQCHLKPQLLEEPASDGR